MRLIDADLFKSQFRADTVTGTTIHRMIDEQPTAYDVDKVLYDLKEAVIPIIDLKMGVKINGIQQTDDAVLYERAIEIVKSGGVADE